MRRNERQVSAPEQILQILQQCKVCRIATQDAQGLYIIPLNFGYHYADNQLTLYLHSAKNGRKVDAFAQIPHVAFEMDCQHQLLESSTPCQYGFGFQSIIGDGQIQLLNDPEEKKQALSALMHHQTGKVFTFNDSMTNTVHVYKILVTSYTAKQVQ